MKRLLLTLGLTEDEGRVYVLLLSHSSITARAAARANRMPATAASRALQALTQRGLATQIPGNPPTYVAVSPHLGLDPVLARREEELRRTRDEVVTLIQAVTMRSQHPAELIEITVGAEATLQRVMALQRGAQRQVTVIDRPPYIAPVGHNPEEQPRLAGGVRYRTIYAKDGATVPGRLGHDIIDSIAQGEEARIHPNPALKMFIADNELALIPIVDKTFPTDAACFVIKPCSLLDALVVLFEREWELSVPIRSFTSGTEEPNSNAEQAAETALVLSALAGGFTDQQVARSLGCSLRTAQRKIAVIMHELSASSRFQAGMIARERGLI